jgi:hypothetical protein
MNEPMNPLQSPENPEKETRDALSGNETGIEKMPEQEETVTEEIITPPLADISEELAAGDHATLDASAVDTETTSEESDAADEPLASLPQTETKEETEPQSEESYHAAVLGQTTESDEDAEDGESEEKETEPEVDYSVYTREELTGMLEELVAAETINSVKKRVAGLKVAYLSKTKEEKHLHYDKFIAEGGIKEEYQAPPDVLEEKFKAAFDIYKAKKSLFEESLEKQKATNLEAKKQILEEIKQLIQSDEPLKKTYDEFKALQEKWRLAGQVPRAEISNLWNNYHFLVEEFFKKVQINKELRDLDLRKNLEHKMQLCEKAEELLLSKSITRSFKQLQKYHEEWKETGPVPADKKDEIWERFRSISDKINQARREYYEKLQEEQQNNLIAKQALCEKLDEVLAGEYEGATAWKEATTQAEELQKLWGTIGRAPVKYNDEIWDRFRSQLKQFYDRRKEYFAGLKEDQMNNYNLKVDLCLQAETLKSSTNWKKTTSDFLQLQEQWKKTGPVPRKYSDKIWKRFRAACDEFFKSKSAYFSNIQGAEQENLTKKESLITRIREYEISDDKAANLDALKNFQREWMETGHVPIEQKERLYQEYRTAINELLDKLQISSAEASAMHYRQRIENMQTGPDGNRNLQKERFGMETKISKMKTDIKLWENNIGFLANSKNAALLKEEFEKKIQKAREEVLLMEAKLKLLNKK